MHPPVGKRNAVDASWRARWGALRNIRPLLRMIWETGPGLSLATVVLRLSRALVPVAMLWVSKLILDAVVARIRGVDANSQGVLVLVAVEFALAVLSDVLGRAVTLFDSLLGDRFTNRVSVRLMQHASRLDLASFEDPVFYDKLERARRQTTGRLGLLAALLNMCQDVLTLLSLSGALVVFSPWLLVLLLAAILPAFLGETHFTTLAYSMLYRWTPQRRELDYLRLLGASNQSAKEVKIFGLGDYLAERYRRISDRFYQENKALSTRRASLGALLNLVSTGGYYGAYVVVLWRTLAGVLTVGDLTFIFDRLVHKYQEKEELIGADIMRQTERIVMLQVIDNQWKDHLLSMDELKQGIGMRGYGQKDPLVEYKKESFVLFQAMMDRIEDEAVRYLFFLQVAGSEGGRGTPVLPFPTDEDEEEEEEEEPAAITQEQKNAARASIQDFTRNIQRKKEKEMAELQFVGGDGGGSSTKQPVIKGAKVGRNDPCPCGSGKKYKKCHGQ